MDKAEELEERINRLEEKLKVTFVEIEKRLNQQQQKPESSIEDHIQELEDLILLLQLENTKLREKVGEGLDFGLAPKVPDVTERIARLESEIANTPVSGTSEIEAKIATLEERITALQTSAAPAEVVAEPTQETEHHVRRKEKITTVMDVIEEESGLLSDVQRILRNS